MCFTKPLLKWNIPGGLLQNHSKPKHPRQYFTKSSSNETPLDVFVKPLPKVKHPREFCESIPQNETPHGVVLWNHSPNELPQKVFCESILHKNTPRGSQNSLKNGCNLSLYVFYVWGALVSIKLSSGLAYYNCPSVCLSLCVCVCVLATDLLVICVRQFLASCIWHFDMHDVMILRCHNVITSWHHYVMML